MATNTSFDQLIANLEKERQEANVANQQRYQQMQAIFDEIVQRYRPGGTFEAQFEQQLGTRKQREVGQAKQDLISSGLFGTERLAGTGRQWESEVGAPARLSAQDLMMQRLSAAQLGKAEAIERVSDTGPDYATIAGLAMQAGQSPTYIGGGTGGRHYGESSFTRPQAAPTIDYEKMASAMGSAMGDTLGKTQQTLDKKTDQDNQDKTNTSTASKPSGPLSYVQWATTIGRNTGPAKSAQDRYLAYLKKTSPEISKKISNTGAAKYLESQKTKSSNMPSQNRGFYYR